MGNRFPDPRAAIRNCSNVMPIFGLRGGFHPRCRGVDVWNELDVVVVRDDIAGRVVAASFLR